MSNVEAIKSTVNEIDLGGKKRRLIFDMNAYAELEKKYGSVEAAMNKLEQGLIGDLRVVLWAGLIHEEVVVDEETGEPLKYNISPYTVGSWIKSPTQLTAVSEKLAAAMNDGMPPAEGSQPEIKNK